MARTKKTSDSEILDKAFEVISREGFHSFTFAQVSKVVALSPAALVKRFKTKKNLATLARNQKWDRNLGEIDPAQIEKLQALNGIFLFLDIIARSVDSNRLGEHAIWLGTEACHYKSKRKVAAYFAQTRSILQRLLREAVVYGEISKDVNTKSLAFTLEALVQGAIFQFAFLEEKNIQTHLRSHFKTALQPWLLKKDF